MTALWDTVKGFAGDVVNMSDSTDKFMNTMSFAGIDTKAVQAATKETRKYADATVYGLDDIQNTTAQLAANGIGNYMELTEAAGNLNAVAGGNADSFKSVAMVLTQTAGAGKLTTENWNQLADAIPGASGKLQEAMLKNGAFTGNFRDAMAKGEITADEFNQALMDIGMTDVAKQAATSTSTIEGAMGNLEAAVTGGLTDAFNLFKPTVTGGINAAATAVTNLAQNGTQGLQTFFTQVKDTGAFNALQTAAQSAGGGLQSLWTGIMAIVNAMTGGQPAGTSFGNVLNAVATAAQTVGGWLKTAGDWISRNTDLVTPLVAAVGGAVAAGTAVTTAMRIAAVAQALLNAVMAANPIMLVITLIAALVAGLTYFFACTNTGKAVWSSFTGFLSGCVQGIIGFFHHRQPLQLGSERGKERVERRSRLVPRTARLHSRVLRQRRQHPVQRRSEHHQRFPQRPQIDVEQRDRLDQRHRRLDQGPQGPDQLRPSPAHPRRPGHHDRFRPGPQHRVRQQC